MPIGITSPIFSMLRPKMLFAFSIKKLVYLKNKRSPMFHSIATISETLGTHGFLPFLVLSAKSPVIYATIVEAIMRKTYFGSPQA